MNGKFHIQTTPDLENGVVDVIAVLDDEKCWVKGFDDTEWEGAEKYAEALAKKLGLEYIGDVCDD